MNVPPSRDDMMRDFSSLSRRLVSFALMLYTRLNLGRNDYNWNVVRILARDGFYLKPDAPNDLRSQPQMLDARVVCFACRHVAFHSIASFMYEVSRSFEEAASNEEPYGYVCSSTSMFYRLPHTHPCSRFQTSIDDHCSFEELDALRQFFGFAYMNNTLTTTSDALRCKVCMDADTDVACLPCGHVYACFGCILEGLKNTQTAHCYVCRSPVKTVQQLYFA